MKAFAGRVISQFRYPLVILAIALVTYCVAMTTYVVKASTHYSATVTGYAFGYKGASGQNLNQDGFANHQPRQLCNGQRDWSGDWAWGTRISIDSPVRQYDMNHNPVYRTDFYLRDNGDPSCGGGMNWADLHFGNYTWLYFDS